MRRFTREAELSLSFFPFICPSVKSQMSQEVSHFSAPDLIWSTLLNSTETSQKVSQINDNTAKRHGPSASALTDHWIWSTTKAITLLRVPSTEVTRTL